MDPTDFENVAAPVEERTNWSGHERILVYDTILNCASVPRITASGAVVVRPSPVL